jgi:glucose-1-phosphate cytidylyltransferase
MKVAILAGGKGTRLAEETQVRPKPMVEIGDKPILWHIMRILSHYGFRDFALALGYKGEFIKRYFIDLCHMSRDLTVVCSSGEVRVHQGEAVNWTVELIDTGDETMTGGRIKRLAPCIGHQTFLLTWGDGVSDLNFQDLLAFHRAHGKLATMAAVRPVARYGHIELDGDRVAEFSEKPQTGEGWINGGFFVLEPEVFEYIEGDSTTWEREPLERLAREGQLMAYRHTGFWQCMDTLREKYILEELWRSRKAPWKIWENGTTQSYIYREGKDASSKAVTKIAGGGICVS